MRGFVFSFLFLLFCQASAEINCNEPYQCEVIIDAGSSGSRAFLYRYLTKGNFPITKLELVQENAVKTALSSVESKELSSYLQELILPITDNAEGSQDLPISLYATAGMRVLSETKQTNLYVELKKLSHETGFNLVEARTISGKEEALFAWLGVNAKMIEEGADNRTLQSVLDFGGGSTQFAYLQKNLNDNSNTVLISWGNRKYKVNVQSFLGLGGNAAFYQFADDRNCFPINYPLANGEKGTGLWHRCRKSLQILINSIHKANRNTGISNQKQWVALGSMPYYIKALVGQENTSLSLKQLYKQGEQAFCNNNWAAIKELYPDSTEYSHTYCFYTSYFCDLLHEAYHLSDESVINVNAKLQFGWTAGALMVSHSRNDG